MKHLFVLNPKSFVSCSEMNDFTCKIKDYFTRCPAEQFDIFVSKYPRNAVNEVKNVVSKSAEMVRVYAVGGDGILFDCLNGIMGAQNAELASVPCGKCNDFIRSFGGQEVEMFKNIAIQATSSTIFTDVIHCGGNCALNFCSIGLATEMLMQVVRILKTIKYRIGLTLEQIFYLGNALAGFNYDLMNQYYSITIDGELYENHFATINIANGASFGGSCCTVPSGVPDDGYLDVLLIKSTSYFKLICILWSFAQGEYDKYPAYVIRKSAKEITIHSPAPLNVDLDGEAFVDANLHVKILPSTIRFVAANNTHYERKIM